MKAILTFTALFWLSIYSISQTSVSPLAQENLQLKNQNTTFSFASPFSRLGDIKSLGKFPGSLTDGQLIEVTPDALNALVKDNHEALLLEIPIEGNQSLQLELVRHQLVTTDFKIVTSESSDYPINYKQGLHYRGVVQDSPNSLAAISIFEGEIMGVISTPKDGNMVLGKIAEDKTNAYIFYKEKDLLANHDFNCGTEDPSLTPEIIQQLKDVSQNPTKSVDNCVQVYLECEYDMFLENGSVESTVDFMTGLFNIVATLYHNENITVTISEIFVWTEPDSYVTSSLFETFVDFRSKRPVYNGDIALMVSRGAPTNGGIAPVNTLCSTTAYAYTYITSTFEQVPTYSWSAYVITHEMGHSLGSYHSHACFWNGDHTAIDGCGHQAGYSEGCSGPIPNSGTIMSYCHLLNNVGIDFSNGFGPQPGDLIRSTVEAAYCLTSCEIACMALHFDAKEIECNGVATGTLEVIPEGGTEPYAYKWSTGDTDAIISNLFAGSYEVTVTDATGCEAISYSIINEPGELVIHATVTHPNHPDAANGIIDLSVSGGTKPYSCLWSNGTITEDLTDLKEGEYDVVIYDAKGCEEKAFFELVANECSHMVTSFPYFEGFEDIGNFGYQNTDDDFDWSINEGKTHTKHTGPIKAHEGSFYLYTESTGNNDKHAIITSNCIDLKGTLNPFLNFAYNMSGPTMGKLILEISDDNGDNWVEAWSQSGDQKKKWHEETISLSDYTDGIIQLRFTGMVDGNESDMAIDAITIVDKTDGLFPAIKPISDFTLFPNPVSKHLTIRLRNNTGQTTGQFVISNITGQNIKVIELDIEEGEKDYFIDVSDLHEGMYFFNFMENNKRPVTEKFSVIR